MTTKEVKKLSAQSLEQEIGIWNEKLDAYVCATKICSSGHEAVVTLIGRQSIGKYQPFVWERGKEVLIEEVPVMPLTSLAKYVRNYCRGLQVVLDRYVNQAVLLRAMVYALARNSRAKSKVRPILLRTAKAAVR